MDIINFNLVINYIEVKLAELIHGIFIQWVKIKYLQAIQGGINLRNLLIIIHIGLYIFIKLTYQVQILVLKAVELVSYILKRAILDNNERVDIIFNVVLN